MTLDPFHIEVARVRITLRLTSPVRLPTYHGHALHGLITRVLDLKPFPRSLAVRCVEWWSMPRSEGSLYRLGVTAFGESRRWLDGLQAGLVIRGAKRHRGGMGSLDGCFEVERYEQLDGPDIEALAQRLSSAVGPLELRFRTPLLLNRPRHRSRGGLRYLNREDFPGEVLCKAVVRRALELQTGVAAPGLPVMVTAMPPVPGDLAVDSGALLNINFRLSRDQVAGRVADAIKPVKGVQGLLRVEGLGGDWLPFLALGACAHLGTAIGYGQGHYRLARGSEADEEWCPPAGSTLAFAMNREHLSHAVERVRRNHDVQHDGWMPPVEVDADALEVARTAVLDNLWYPDALTGALVPKPGHGVRALAIPSPTDRVLQRAVHDALDPDLDQLFEESSYAYRKGRSVKMAARAIERARSRGFEWVLDADITAFFDNVDWDALAGRLDAILGDDPLKELIMRWTEAPVRFAGVEYPRIRGLPQGAPLSPLLANLYLDALDEHLIADGFMVVRYADDFVVLCRGPDEAQHAKEEVLQELAVLHLELNEAKTDVVSFAEGFRFLGIQFGDIGETNDAPGRGEVDDARLSVGDGCTKVEIPVGSWLAEVPFRTVERVLESARLRAAHQRSPTVRRKGLSTHAVNSSTPEQANAISPHDVGETSAWAGPVERRPLFISDLSARAFLRGEKIVVTREEHPTVELPVRAVSHLTLLGPTRVTLPLVLRCTELGVPVYFCRAGGTLRAAIAPPPEWPVVRRQLASAGRPEVCLAFARRVVEAKLHNAATLVVRFGFDAAPERGAELRALRDACGSATTVHQVLGYEGRGARLYFEGWAASLDATWGFTRRIKHPSPDPINALLSLTYTVLHQHVGSALVAAGLDPRIGLIHRERGAHHALASDLQEEFRHLAEGVVWSGVRHGWITPDQFALVGGDAPVSRMTGELRRRVVRTMEQRLFSEFTPLGGGRRTYREFMDGQARRFAELLGDGMSGYRPLRLRA